MQKLLELIGLSSDNATSSEKLPEINDYHKDVIAPSSIEENRRYLKIGEDYCSVIFIKEWPDWPQDHALYNLLAENQIETDVSIHLYPKKSKKVKEDLSERIESKRISLGSTEGQDRTREVQQKKRKEIANLEYVEKALDEQAAKLYDIGCYILVRGSTKKEVRENRRDIKDIIEENPMNATASVLLDEQIAGAQTVAPVGNDEVRWNRKALSGGVAAMYPFQSQVRLDENGVEAGFHLYNETPLMYDRWNFDNGYNEIKVGMIGSGKSYSTKLTLLRSWAMNDDISIYMMDPLEGFEEVYEHFGAERIVIGGNMEINPLRIEQTNIEKVKEQELNPYANNLAGVEQFFSGFFDFSGYEYGQEKYTLSRAIKLAYKNKGINKNVETHDRESPTISDVLNILEEMVRDPEKFIDITDQQKKDSNDEIIEDEKKIIEEEKAEGNDISDVNEAVSMLKDRTRSQAQKLLEMLDGFKKGGQYENFNGKTEDKMKIGSEDSAWLDLKPLEDRASGGKELGWYMRLILKEVYNEAKRSQDKTILSLDEAHYMLESDSSVDYLSTIVRHSRHFNIALQFITQGTNEFFTTENGRTIVQNCAIKWFQKVESIPDEALSALNLSSRQYEFVRAASPGDAEQGFSEALIKIDNDDYVPIKVVPSSYEAEILE